MKKIFIGLTFVMSMSSFALEKNHNKLESFYECENYATLVTNAVKDKLESSHSPERHDDINVESYVNDLNGTYSSIYSACLTALIPKLSI